ncbi:MAG: hypothetical protein GY817_07370 [bacterium]|nr:hypothetical protein [bacterium]
MIQLGLFLLSCYFIQGQKYQLYNLTTNKVTTEFFIQKSWLDVIFSPFIDIADYFIHFQAYQPQITSWFIWIILAGVILAIKHKKAILILKAFLLFCFLVIFILFIRYPGNKLVSKNPENILVDYHSHTYYSWDGMASLERSLAYHKANGFDAFAITEHDILHPNIIITEDPVIILGEELKGRDNYHLIYNIDKKIDARALNHDINRINKKVDEMNGVICAALWWEHSSFDKLQKKPIDAYEIANMGHRTSNNINVEKSINDPRLPKIGTTDWHGWAFRATIWTAVKIPHWQEMTFKEKQKSLVHTLKGNYRTQVIEQKREEVHNNLRYIFEPFIGLFYLLTAKNFINLVSWFIWIIILTFLYKKKLSWLILGVTIFSYGLKFFITWYLVSAYNRSLKTVAISFIIVGILAVFVALKKR